MPSTEKERVLQVDQNRARDKFSFRHAEFERPVRRLKEGGD